MVQTPTNPSNPEQTSGDRVIPITGVKANPTDKGVEVILETTGGKQLQVVNRSTGSNFIADITGGQLRLANGDAFTFRSEKPIAGITQITVTNLDANTVRVTVIGEKALPTVELFDDNAGLVFGITSQETATQPPQQPQTPQAQEKPAAPQSQPSAQQDQPIELVVTGELDEYRVPDATAGTRTDTPLRDIPQSIQVIPQQVLEDRKVNTVSDALENVSGVTNRGSYQGYKDNVNIRGFVLNTFHGNFFKDGIRLFIYGFPETANLERIEVLKGPASVLYGQAAPGGIVNLVPKLPLNSPFYFLEATAGSYDNYEGALDFSGPVNDSKSVLYRLNSVYRNTGSFRDFVEGERFFIGPTLSWAIGPNTSLRIDGEYLDESRTTDTGIVALGDRPANIPRNRYLGEPFGNFERTEYNIAYLLDHKFSSNWSIRNAFRTQIIDSEQIQVLPGSLDESTGELTRSRSSFSEDYDIYSVVTDVIGKFQTGSIAHQLLLGFEYARTVEVADVQFDDPYPSINIFNPIYTRQSFSREPKFFRDDTTDTYGFYIQDQISLLPNLKLLVGGRFSSYVQNRSERFLGQPAREFEQSDSKFSPRVGIVYQPSNAVSLYASYANSFEPSYGTSRNADNSTFEPQTGTQYEIGIKTDFLDGRLSATLAGFILKKQNLITDDPNEPDPFFVIQTGEQTSKGIELDIVGEILPGWKIIASATYLDARISEDETFPVGNRLDNTAETSASLWTTYDIQRGNLKGLGFGLGLYYVGDRFGDLANSYILPSYFRTDAALFYRRNNWRAALNFKNIFGVEYFEGSDSSRNQIQPGAPLTVIGSLSIEF